MNDFDISKMAELEGKLEGRQAMVAPPISPDPWWLCFHRDRWSNLYYWTIYIVWASALITVFYLEYLAVVELSKP